MMVKRRQRGSEHNKRFEATRGNPLAPQAIR